MRGIPWVAEKLLASQEGLCFMELVGYYQTVGSKRRPAHHIVKINA
jgi:hypothetical protein